MKNAFANGSEFADWQSAWCYRCTHDHLFSHPPHDGDADGCEIVVTALRLEDVPEWTPHGEKWFMSLPTGVVCSKFELCTAPECSDSDGEEKRSGETYREFWDRLRTLTIAEPEIMQKEEA